MIIFLLILNYVSWIILFQEPSDDQNAEICYETACNRLVNEAIRKHSGDNVTVVIVSVKKFE